MNPRKWLAAHEIVALLVLCVLAFSVWFFIELAEEVFEEDTRKFDESIMLSMRETDDPADPIGPPWLEEAFRDITALGATVVLGAVTLAVSGYLILRRKYTTLLFVLVAIIGGTILTYSLKWGFDRPRPDLVPHISVVYTSSFPSGHSMLAAVIYLTLTALLAQIHPDLRIKIYLLSLGITLTVLVGLSRIYLGVHWPTDVLAGWAAGAAWAGLCWLVAWTLRHRSSLAARLSGR